MSQSHTDYVCDYCARSFTRKYNLQTHIENCHLNSSCYCDICNQRFGSPAGLQLHLSRGHNRFGQGLPECDICGRIFTRKQNITSHMITVHLQGGRQDIRCKICNKTFTTDRNLKRHVNQLHNPDIEYPTCDNCHKVFKGKHSLIAHIQSAHSSVFKGLIKCNLCGKVYTNNRNLKRHVEMNHGERGEYKCDICPKVYTSNQSLRRHARTHTAYNYSQFNCEHCSKTFIGKDSLENHVLFCHRQENSSSNEYDAAGSSRIYECEFCNNGFEYESRLRYHIKSEHSFQEFYSYCKKTLLKATWSSEKPRKQNLLFYNCEYCINAFSTVYDLKDHMRSHHDREYNLSTCNVCFSKFFSKETLTDHKKICFPPDNVNSCSHCDKLFTDISSLKFHTRIFHPQAQVADSNISSTNMDDSSEASFKCIHCDRIYYSERSLKHHVKLKHTTEQAVECQSCGKICNNKYYLASHMKIVHNNDAWSKCDYCDKQFKSKRNIRRHIEYTHLGMQRYKCIECETLFKEKRSLRKHVRTKHPDSTAFPQCHICQKRFESAKSCKIHLKLLHSFNMNTHPCDLCSVSFTSIEALNIHLSTKHLAEDEIYKCEECNMVFKGQERFDHHNESYHINVPTSQQKPLPRCIICMKDFSTRKTLKRHIKKFHCEFNVDELATYGSRNRTFNVDCGECLKNFNDDFYFSVYQKLKHLRDSVIFKCETCVTSYSSLEYAIQRYKQTFDISKSKLYLSELCTTEMSDADDFEYNEIMEPESTTSDIKIEPVDEMNSECVIKLEPMTP
ncbi:zinc finger protein 91-like [Nymphalis io]|uniref:zinc finger protein 91-like n=1 Tax=Inachis io TaxID=171585 RepID=UPI0021698314|nr:zinc finger protein 91-like [Nymphalis io]